MSSRTLTVPQFLCFCEVAARCAWLLDLVEVRGLVSFIASQPVFSAKGGGGGVKAGAEGIGARD
jgi:hypothetical protein